MAPGAVKISGDVPPKLKAALAKSILPVGEATVDQANLEEQLLKLTGTGGFDTATYEFLREQDKNILNIRVGERSNGTAFLRPGIFMEAETGYGMRFGLGGRLTLVDFGGPASEWRTDSRSGLTT